MSKLDPTVSRLAEVVRDEPQEDPRWEAYARGEASAEDQAELEAFAAEAEAYRPLDAAARERIAGAVLAKLASASSREATSSADARPDAGDRGATRAGDGAGAVVAMRPARRNRLGWGALGFAAVAAAALFFVVRPSPAHELPAYAMIVEGGDKAERGDVKAGDVAKLGPSSILSIGLRPATRVDEPVAARAFLVKDGKAQAWDAPIEIAEGGAMRLKGSRSSLFGKLPAGAWEIAIAVGHPGGLPSAADVEAALATGVRDGAKASAYKVLHYRVELQPED